MTAFMLQRLAFAGLGAALLAALAFGVVPGCYSAPQPDCGFVCGSAGECPDGYYCSVETVCHRNGTPTTMSCPYGHDAALSPDTPILLDGHQDAPPDSPPPDSLLPDAIPPDALVPDALTPDALAPDAPDLDGGIASDAI